MSTSAEVATTTAVGIALLAFQTALIAEGMELTEAFLGGFATILAVLNDVVLAIRYVYSAVTVHKSHFLIRQPRQLFQVVHVKIIAVGSADGR